MAADRTYTRIDFDAPGSYPLDVKVYSPDGTLLRIISGAELRKRAPATSHAAVIEPHRAGFVIPTVARRKKPKVERD